MPNTPELPRRKVRLAVGGGTSSAELGRRQVDICFVFDTTGSMGNKIDGLIRCMVDFVRELSVLALDWRISVVPFGDLTVPGDQIVHNNPFVGDLKKAEKQLVNMPRNSGGGNVGESAIEAIDTALVKTFRPNAVKMIILLTDEPALISRRSPAAVQQDLLDREFMLFAVATGDQYYRQWAETTGGTWYPIGSAVDMSAILALLRQLAAHLAHVANQVHALAGGSVKQYLALERGQ